jgi:hypothetical protein
VASPDVTGNAGRLGALPADDDALPAQGRTQRSVAADALAMGSSQNSWFCDGIFIGETGSNPCK